MESSTSPTLQYGNCALCKGKGTFLGKKCTLCDGFGLWEFVVDDNEGAVRFLVDPQADVSENAKILCGQRIHSIPPDFMIQYLEWLNQGATPELYNRINDIASRRWGWAWLHTNRFAIELTLLNGIHAPDYAFALMQLSWHWLEREKQGKVEAPKNFDVPIDKEAPPVVS